MIQFSQEEDLTGSRGSVDLTPMIDMVFILLVFFLLTSVVLLPAISVDLPDAETGEDKSEIELTVTLKENGTILLNDSIVNKTGLLSELLQLQEDKSVKEVFIESDESLPFGSVINVTDIVRQAGLPQSLLLSSRVQLNKQFRYCCQPSLSLKTNSFLVFISFSCRINLHLLRTTFLTASSSSSNPLDFISLKFLIEPSSATRISTTAVPS